MYFEQWEVGFKYRSPSATITEAHFVNYHSLTNINHPYHTSEEAAKTHSFGKRFATGSLALVFSMGLTGRRGFREEGVVGYLGLDNVRFTSPVFIGDTIEATEEVTEKKDISSPDKGIVRLHTIVTNQRGQVVCTYDNTYLFAKKPHS